MRRKMESLSNRAGRELLEYPDCSMLTERGRCTCLSLPRCRGPKCPFQKSARSLQGVLSQTYRRLSALDEATQAHIAEKYYGGKRPWN